MNINHGPFKGVSPAQDELRSLLNGLGEPEIRDGKPVQLFALHARTQRFLEVFPPSEGWAVIVESAPGQFELPDPATRDSSGTMVTNPTLVFSAKLLNANGRIIATAQYMKIINSVTAMQEGESAVRGRLYDALGLPASIQSDTLEVVRDASAAPTRLTAPMVHLITPELSPAVEGEPAIPPDVQAILDRAADEEQVPQITAVASLPVPSAPTPPVSHTPVASQVAPSSAVNVPALPSTVAKNGEDLIEALIRQTHSRAQLRGVVLPDQFESRAHLNDFYNGLCRSVAA
jgi:hypothetical protein